MSERQPSSLPSDQSNNQPESHPKINPRQKPNFWASLKDRGEAVVNTAVGIGGAAAKQTYQWIEQTTRGAGRAVALIGKLPLLKNPFVQRVAGVLRLDWLVGMATQVDLVKAQEEVNQLRQKYPDESPGEIAHSDYESQSYPCQRNRIYQ